MTAVDGVRRSAAAAEAVEVRDAATVMLVRDGADGLEVFMLRRNLRSEFVGGAYVFPGGAVDGSDRDGALAPFVAGRTDEQASALLDVAEGGLAFWVAAIRESFEEAGLLLAADATGALVRIDDPGREARFAEHRRAVDLGDRSLAEVCTTERLVLAVDQLHYFSHWITPVGPPRRYDTRFFVARAPAAQVALHDDRETIANIWIRPADALARHRDGTFDLILPTIRNLLAIDRFSRADDLLEVAAHHTEIPTIVPKIVDDGGGLRIVLPGDPGYERALAVTRGSLPDGIPMPGRPGGPEIEGVS